MSLSRIFPCLFLLPREWVTDCSLCFPRRAYSLFLCFCVALKAQWAAVMDVEELAVFYLLLAQLATATNPLKIKSLLVVCWLREDSILRVLSLFGFCKWLTLCLLSEYPVSLKEKVLSCAASYLHLICLWCTLFLLLPSLLYQFTLRGHSGSPRPAPKWPVSKIWSFKPE